MVNRWRKEYEKYPDTAFGGRGNIYKEDARIAELEWLVGKIYTENVFLPKDVIKTLKYVDVYLNEYETFSDALENIGRFIDDVYDKNDCIHRLDIYHLKLSSGR